MYSGLLHAHNGMRWLVLLTLLLVVFVSLVGWLRKSEWTRINRITVFLVPVLMDIQFLVGIILYAGVSPITKAAFADFGGAMKNPELRFYAVEHIFIMLAALVLVHIGSRKTNRISVGWKKHRAVFLYFGISLLLILAGIPWNRAMF